MKPRVLEAEPGWHAAKIAAGKLIKTPILGWSLPPAGDTWTVDPITVAPTDKWGTGTLYLLCDPEGRLHSPHSDLGPWDAEADAIAACLRADRELQAAKSGTKPDGRPPHQPNQKLIGRLLPPRDPSRQ